MLDSSGSVGKENFERMKSFVKILHTITNLAWTRLESLLCRFQQNQSMKFCSREIWTGTSLLQPLIKYQHHFSQFICDYEIEF